MNLDLKVDEHYIGDRRIQEEILQREYFYSLEPNNNKNRKKFVVISILPLTIIFTFILYLVIHYVY